MGPSARREPLFSTFQILFWCRGKINTTSFHTFIKIFQNVKNLFRNWSHYCLLTSVLLCGERRRFVNAQSSASRKTVSFFYRDVFLHCCLGEICNLLWFITVLNVCYLTVILRQYVRIVLRSIAPPEQSSSYRSYLLSSFFWMRSFRSPSCFRFEFLMANWKFQNFETQLERIFWGFSNKMLWMWAYSTWISPEDRKFKFRTIMNFSKQILLQEALRKEVNVKSVKTTIGWFTFLVFVERCEEQYEELIKLFLTDVIQTNIWMFTLEHHRRVLLKKSPILALVFKFWLITNGINLLFPNFAKIFRIWKVSGNGGSLSLTKRLGAHCRAKFVI